MVFRTPQGERPEFIVFEEQFKSEDEAPLIWWRSRTSRGGSGLDLTIDLVVKDREVAKIHYSFSNVMVIGGT